MDINHLGTGLDFLIFIGASGMLEKFTSRCQIPSNHLDRDRLQSSVTRVWRVLRDEPQQGNVIEVMRTASRLKQSDDRDKIYGVLSLLEPASQARFFLTARTRFQQFSPISHHQ